MKSTAPKSSKINLNSITVINNGKEETIQRRKIILAKKNQAQIRLNGLGNNFCRDVADDLDLTDPGTSTKRLWPLAEFLIMTH